MNVFGKILRIYISKECMHTMFYCLSSSYSLQLVIKHRIWPTCPERLPMHALKYEAMASFEFARNFRYFCLAIVFLFGERNVLPSCAFFPLSNWKMLQSGRISC